MQYAFVKSKSESIMSFENKVIIVTGAASGIGEAIAKRFAELSANVVLVDKDEKNLKKVLESCKDGINKHLTIAADLYKEEKVFSVVPKTVEKFGKIDVLINSAGRMVDEDILGDNVARDYDLLMNVNLKAPILLTSKAAPYLIESKGNIINIASVRAVLPAKKTFLYCASKAGLEMFSKCMAVELAEHGVRVNTVHPGYVETNLYHSMNSEMDLKQLYSSIEESLPFGVIKPEEIAKLVTFMASDDARSITGSSYHIDGCVAHLARNLIRCD